MIVSRFFGFEFLKGFSRGRDGGINGEVRPVGDGGKRLCLYDEAVRALGIGARTLWGLLFRSAKKRNLITDNPFAEVSAKAVIRQDRQRFITQAETRRLLAACDPTWKVIVAPSRYGGLRFPSEVLSLRWEDIDWEAGRIVVQSPKTEHHVGKATRTIQLFPELRPILTDAFETAADGAVYVVDGNHRESANTKSGWRNCNLRSQFERLVKRAGLTP